MPNPVFKIVAANNETSIQSIPVGEPLMLVWSFDEDSGNLRVTFDKIFVF